MPSEKYNEECNIERKSTSCVFRVEVCNERSEHKIYEKKEKKPYFDQINTGLGSVDWKKEFVGRNLNECYASFLNECLRLYEKHVLEKREILRKSEKWMNYEVNRVIKLKHRAWYKMKSCKKSSFEIIKSDYENRLSKIAKSDPKLIYAYVRTKMGVKEEIRMLRTKEDEVTSDEETNDNMFPFFHLRTSSTFDIENVMQELNEDLIERRLEK
ncbi:RNA-directed DNA polymerase from mobile element jockey-like [Brachionus plicatilis]|uniref:RNA-directed DNA polymerase from mobile element jockey-like n=1 Tax=Brachionus plicatilis TaxID=10195 RepID=A0A3M7S1I0_BRAPC|nr:RNA-directed DNA polymerase from mobile element jockey-like [Brachionus plicatilis]